MTRLRILGAAALALVMLAPNALAQETSSDARQSAPRHDGTSGAIRMCELRFVRRFARRFRTKGLKGVSR